MARIKGPNGLVLTVPDMTATDLVEGRSGQYVRVEDEKPVAKKSAAKPSSKKD
jgi:hypothetical protein